MAPVQTHDIQPDMQRKTMNLNTERLSSPERLAKIERLNLTSAVIRPVFDRLTRLTARVLRAPVCLITLVDAEQHHLVSSIGLPEPYAGEGLLPLNYSLCQYVASTARPIILEDVRCEPAFASLPAVTELNMIAYAGIPLILRSGIALGALAVIDRQPRAWSDEERANLDDLAHSVITEIELRDELLEHKAADVVMRHSIEQMRILRRIEAELAETLNLDSVLNVAMDAALRASRAENAIIGLIKEDQLEIAAAAGTWAFSPGVRLPRDIGIIGRVLRTGVGELIPNVDADPDYIRYIPSTRAQMAIPLAYRDRQIGILNLETSRPERFTPESFEFLSLVAGRIAISIDNAQLYNLLNDQFNSLQALYARVRDLEQTKTDMIRIAAHDLRNPLSMVIGYAELLEETATELTPAQLDFIRSIVRGGQKMKKIIADILSLERIEAKINEAITEYDDLVGLTQAVCAEYLHLAAEKGLTLVTDLTGEEVIIPMDSTQIREAIDNLIGNAVKYTPAGGTITVTLTCDEHRARLTVTDTGAGIPLEQQERLFQPFYRAATEATRKAEGTGLGLHLVKKIVERHHGEIIFRSEVGVGSTFGFSLPLERTG